MSYKNAKEDAKAFISRVKTEKNGAYAVSVVNKIIQRAGLLDLSYHANRMEIGRMIEEERTKNDYSLNYSPHLADFFDTLENQLIHDWA